MRLVIIFILFPLSLTVNAQEVFVPFGKITFEKKVNMARTMEDLDLPSEAKEKMPKYAISNWEFYFSEHKSLYRAEKKENATNSLFSSGNSSGEIYTDYAKNQRVMKRSVMGDTYLLRDTVPTLSWKIMQDTRVIAGYDCRKAIGIIHDTIYVVAFYTDEILLRGGPEGFGGLPGTILGLAIPRYNSTWFATKVSGFENHLSEIIPANSGKRIESEQDLKKLIELFTRYEQDKKQKAAEARKRLYGFTL